MKKSSCYLCALLLLLSLTACRTFDPLPFLATPTEFSFLSGAGGWQTVLTLHADGTFAGWFRDSDMGDQGDAYPDGTAYVCSFSGHFENIQKAEDGSYAMTLAEVTTDRNAGEEWIEDGTRYVASDPYGIALGTEFVLYTPDTPIDTLPDKFLSWWPYLSTGSYDTLTCYGLRNVATEEGFFSAE